MTILRTSLAVLAAGLVLAGCEQAPLDAGLESGVAGSNTLETLDLDEPYGGLAWSDEPAAFGDATLEAEVSAEAEVALRFSAEEDSLTGEHPDYDRPDLVRTWLRVVWGNMDGRPDDRSLIPDRQPLVWDGQLSVNGENMLAVKAPLRFEFPFDHLTRRTDRQVVGWHSSTGWHVDGILVCVLSKPDSNGALAGTLEFATGPLTTSFDLSELDGLAERIAVDEAGNAVAFRAFRPDLADRCARGFMGGAWMSDPDGPGGVFRGRFVLANGHFRACLAGRYGTNDQGERVFAGKIIARDGTLLGLVAGQWEPSPDLVAGGHFHGRWVNRNGERMGELRGRYQAGPRGHGGFFEGAWAESCEPGDDDAGA